MKLTCAVTIATHNRKEDLERTCRVLGTLQPQPDEVIICADGCTDGTALWCSATLPNYQLIIHETSRGSVASRNEMMRMAASDILLGLDDDSYPIETDFLDRVGKLFANNQRLAVATFPQRTNEFPESLEATDFGPPQFFGSYFSGASAIRRSVFLELGGYPAQFRHAYEEPDFALRCVAAGYHVRYETSLTIRHHYTGVQRNEQRTHHFHARNELWSVIMRCPAPQLFAVAAFRIVRQFGYACKRGVRWVVREPVWWFEFLSGLPQCLRTRQPIRWEIYKNWMQLVREPIFSEEEWLDRFGAK